MKHLIQFQKEASLISFQYNSARKPMMQEEKQLVFNNLFQFTTFVK